MVEVLFDVDEFVLPVRHAYVSIPVHYRQAANERLKVMELTDIIEPAKEAPRWISGMSAVPKGKNDFSPDSKYARTKQGDPATIPSNA